MAADGAIIYDVTALAVGGGGALPAAHFTHGNSDWLWVGFAESQGFIYVAGYSGDKSLIYSMAVKPDGTALDQPTVAGNLPEGEIVTCIYGYLGRFLAIGTSRGFRLALVSEGGGLTIGALIETASPVRCFEGQAEFIWYGNSNVPAQFGINDSPASGLGRMSTATFSNVDAFVPAYANDIFTEESTGNVISAVTFDNRTVFSVDGAGVYAAEPDKVVPYAFITTGHITYGISDYKTALYLDVSPLDANGIYDTLLRPFVETDSSEMDDLGEFSMSTAMPTITVGEKIGRDFMFTLEIDANGQDIANGIRSWLIRAQPRPEVTHLIFVTVLMTPRMLDLNGTLLVYDTQTELSYIEGLNLSKEIVVWEENGRTYPVVIEDYEVDYKGLVNDTDGTVGANTSCTMKLKRV